MEQLNIALAVTGTVVVVLALFSVPLKKSILQEPLVAVLAGVAVGPYGVGGGCPHPRSAPPPPRNRSGTT